MKKAMYITAVMGVLVGSVLAGERPTTLPVFPWKWADVPKSAIREPHVEQLVGGTRFSVEWDPRRPGGTVTAKGEKTWSSSLKGLGVVAASVYRNSIAMEADEKYVMIYGEESLGRYVEAKDAQTGDTLMVTQLWANRDRQTGKLSPAPAQVPTDTWEWNEKAVDDALTINARMYLPGKTSEDPPRSTISAIDLGTRQMLWTSKVHGFYVHGDPVQNVHLNLRVADGRLVVYGMETRGWFVEIIHPSTGASSAVIQFWRRPTAAVPASKMVK